MSLLRQISNQRTGEVVLARARWCKSFWCHFKGLMFSAPLRDDEGLIFVLGGENIAQATIHMLFMRFAIGVVWVDAAGRVVDKRHAKVWRPAYAPRSAAKYFVEAMPSILERVEIGDILTFTEVGS